MNRNDIAVKLEITEPSESSITDGDSDPVEDVISFNSYAYSDVPSDVPSDVIIKKRIKYGSRWQLCKSLIMEYFKKTSIHGMRYLCGIHTPGYEKFYWFLLILTSAYFSVSFIWDAFLKWQDCPVILGFDETLVPVYKIPFPTVTICPEIKTNQNVFDFSNFSTLMSEGFEEFQSYDNYANLTDEQFAQFSAILHICDLEVVRKYAQFVPKHIYPNVAEILVDLSVSKNETGPMCKWNGRFYFCDKIFNFVATDEGICYQFNGMQSKDIYRDPSYLSYNDEDIVDFNNFFDELPLMNNLTGTWSLEDGYVGQGYNSYPQRTVFSSARNAFFAFLQGFEHNLDYACRSSKQGYKVFLNSPESVPSTTGNYILVPHGDEVIVGVLPEYIVSDKNLHDFSPEKRQCFFNNERYLRFFRTYSQINCQTECLANYTISKCGCAKFWMPKPLDVPICGLADIECHTAAQKELSIILQNQTMQKTVDETLQIMCDCMPSCTSLRYNVEMSRAYYDMANTLIALREDYEFDDFLGSRLSVHFKEAQFTAIKRRVVFNTTSLIANWGCILGLFMGVSLLSIVELCYFFSIRLFVNLRRRYLSRKKRMHRQKAMELDKNM